MPRISETELKSLIKEGVSGAYLLYGDEKYLVKTYSDRLSSFAENDPFKDFNFRIFEGDEYTLEDVYDSACAVPVMAERKCVIVRDFAADKLDDKGLKALEGLLEDNPEDNCLVFSYAASSLAEKHMKNLAKLFEKHGYACEFGKLGDAELSRILERGAKSRGKTFAPGAASGMVQSVGSDLNLLSNELDKLCSYCGGDVITINDVNSVCVKSLDAKVFDMIRKLSDGKFDDAFHKLTDLLENRTEPTMIMGALISQYSDMYRCKALKESGLGASELSKYYANYRDNKGAPKTYRIDSAAKNASLLTMRQMRRCIEILSQADRELKTSFSSDPRPLLEKTLVMLARSDKF